MALAMRPAQSFEYLEPGAKVGVRALAVCPCGAPRSDMDGILIEAALEGRRQCVGIRGRLRQWLIAAALIVAKYGGPEKLGVVGCFILHAS